MDIGNEKGYERIGLRVTAFSNMGNRKYMEDEYSVAYQKTNDGSELDFAYFGMFDGHGGDTAAIFAKNHLMNFIVDQPGFWSDNDEDVLKAIKTGFVECHLAMWRDLDNWPPTSSGLPSTAGTTASIAFIRKGKLYIGHAGDSGIVLGSQNPNGRWDAQQLTVDHKPESPEERRRIEEYGGKVVEKLGIHRVVWYRPRFPHRGPIRRNTKIEEIPFLAVARSLGDLWSYNWRTRKFMVSPEPDVAVYKIDAMKDKCLIFASDGLWNIMDGQMAVDLAYEVELSNDQNARIANKDTYKWLNPSRHLVEVALQKWREQKMRSDNTSVVCVMLDVPNKTNNFGNVDQEHNSRTIYDYSTSEAYNLDYIDMNPFNVHQNYNFPIQDAQSINSYPFYNNNPFGNSIIDSQQNTNQLPSFSTGYHSYSHSTFMEQHTGSTSADLTYHTSSNECAFVKGCCPNERFLLARANEQTHYHATFDQHKEMYQNMAQQPFPPLHYAYRQVPNMAFFSQEANSGYPNWQRPQKPIERFNYMRPTEAELAEIHDEMNNIEEEEPPLSDTDTEEMEWSDDEKGNDMNENVEEKNSELDTSSNSNSNETPSEAPENPKIDSSIQIFEISSSNLGINAKSIKPERSNNKENSEMEVKKKRTIKIIKIGRYYETRQTNCKMRSGNIRSSSGIQKTIGKEKGQRRIAKYTRRAVKAMHDMKASTSNALKRIESIATIKSISSNNKNKTPEKAGHEKTSSPDSRILRSSQTDVKTSPAIKKAMKEKVFKVNVSRNLRSNALLSEKSIARKKK